MIICSSEPKNSQSNIDQMKCTSIIIACLISLASFTQTFNKRLNWTNSIYADGRNCFEVNEGYVFFASYLDTLKLVKSGCIFTDAEGEITLEIPQSKLSNLCRIPSVISPKGRNDKKRKCYF